MGGKRTFAFWGGGLGGGRGFVTECLSVELMADCRVEADGKTSEIGPLGINEGRKEQPQSVASMEWAAGKNSTIPDQRQIWGN